MFKIPRVNVIESNAGFSVEVLGRTGILYKENEKELFVDSEILNGSSGLVIYSSSIKYWKPPFENEVIAEEKRKEIVRNIVEAFKFNGFEIEVS